MPEITAPLGALRRVLGVPDPITAPLGKLRAAVDLHARIALTPEHVNQDPTPAQKQAGNYRKGHVKLHGLDITIENPKDSFRRGVDRNGVKWEQQLHHHYGYIRRVGAGNDSDAVDCFVGPHEAAESVYVVNQIDPVTGDLDEHKCMLGFVSKEAAQRAYLSNYAYGWQGLGSITELSVDAFKRWLVGEDKSLEAAGRN